jgi:hypothetical protein
VDVGAGVGFDDADPGGFYRNLDRDVAAAGAGAEQQQHPRFGGDRRSQPGAHAPGSGLDAAMQMMMQFAVSQAQVQAHQARARDAREEHMVRALEALGQRPAADGAPTSGEAGLRGMARLESIRAQLETDPQSFTKSIRANALKTMEMPGAHASGATMVSYMTRWMPMGRASKPTTLLAYGVANALDEMQAGQWLAAEAHLHLLLAALEVSQYDGGRWQMAWLLTHMPEPPWHMFVLASPPQDAIRAYGRLCNPLWIEGASQYIADVAKLKEQRGKVTSQDAEHAGAFEGEEPVPGRAQGRATAQAKAKAKAAAAAAAAAAHR